MFIVIALFVLSANAGPATETYQNQFCTDPRTMAKHPAYTEWADAYSCARHRCQPGGRNLAIYTVGCKRVEAPESAIECEEVVEDTNMQFPYCCTRLRCLVVVRGEVWTRVLGQPWETLPAAPWSHMYKMKKPPPSDTNFLPKTGTISGPVYELAEPSKKKIMRSSKRDDASDCHKPRALENSVPDIIIALDTENKKNKDDPEEIVTKHKKEKPAVSGSMFEAETYEPQQDTDLEETTEKMQGQEIPSNQWNENEPFMDEANNKETGFQSDLESEKQELSDEEEKKPASLQTLVDAIGTRMKDIEDVVQKMTDKVQGSGSEEKKLQSDAEIHENRKEKRPSNDEEHYKRQSDTEIIENRKRPNRYDDHYKRFTIKNRSKFAHSIDRTTEPPSFIEDTNMNAHFSDGDNLIRRSKSRDQSLTYMAPVETRRKSSLPETTANEEESVKHKKHAHKKGKKKGHNHKKHHGREKDGRRFNKVDKDIEKNVVSLEESSAPVGN